MGVRFEEIALQVMATEHVTYEVDRLSLWSSVRVEREHLRIDDESIREVVYTYVSQATLETALLHLRCLTEFLVDKRPTKHKVRDLRADDYFDAGWANRPKHLFGSNHEEHVATLNEIHRRLAHITTYRLTFPYSWTPVLAEVPHVLSVYKTFVRDLREAHPERGRWFDRSIFLLNARENPGVDVGTEITL